MLSWFRKKRSLWPAYSLLREMPSRGLPNRLHDAEAAPSFAERTAVLREHLEKPGQRPPIDALLFTGLVGANHRGLMTLRSAEGEMCVLVFTTPIRAADYSYTRISADRPAGLVDASPEQLLEPLRELDRQRATWFTLDLCPRCQALTVVAVRSMKSPEDLVGVWALHESMELARLELYDRFAWNAAREGRLELARDVALETVGHVRIEHPRGHFLLGELALALADRTLLQEARVFLSVLGQEQCVQRLEADVAAGRPRFDDPLWLDAPAAPRPR